MATILTLIPLTLSSLLLSKPRITTVASLARMSPPLLLTLVVIPVIDSLLVELRRGGAGSGHLLTPPPRPARCT